MDKDVRADTPQQKGGKARAASLTDKERKASARRAAQARWVKSSDPTIPKATHMGTLQIGDASIECAVLDDGERVQRVLTQRTFLRAIGRDWRLKGRRFRPDDVARAI